MNVSVGDLDQAEEGVCVDGTTYYMQAAQALCGISDAIPAIDLSSSYTQKETAPHRQFPGKAYSLYEENLQYPTLFLSKTLRQVGSLSAEGSTVCLCSRQMEAPFVRPSVERAIAMQYSPALIESSDAAVKLRSPAFTGRIRSAG